jgi:hypothetical protein
MIRVLLFLFATSAMASVCTWPDGDLPQTCVQAQYDASAQQDCEETKGALCTSSGLQTSCYKANNHNDPPTCSADCTQCDCKDAAHTWHEALDDAFNSM